MSAKGRGTESRAQDAYETPDWVVGLLDAVQGPVLPRAGCTWLEPCAGSGAIVRGFRRPPESWMAVELRAECAPQLAEALRPPRLGAVLSGDFLSVSETWVEEGIHFDVAVTNPPYSLAQEFLERCLAVADHVVFLLRLNYLASEKRAEFMQRNPPDVYVLPNRPTFTGGGSDATEYCWCHWPPERDRRAGRLRVLPSVPLAERRP